MKESTEVRLENLERELALTKAELCRVRRRNLWLLGGGVLMAGLLALPWMFMDTGRIAQAQGDATVHQVIRANKFVVVDGRGTLQAFLSMDTDGPILALMDGKGTPRANLGVTKKGVVLSLRDERDKAGVSLYITKEGTGLTLLDERGTPRAGLVVANDGRPGLVLMDEKGKIVRSFFIPY